MVYTTIEGRLRFESEMAEEILEEEGHECLKVMATVATVDQIIPEIGEGERECPLEQVMSLVIGSEMATTVFVHSVDEKMVQTRTGEYVNMFDEGHELHLG